MGELPRKYVDDRVSDRFQAVRVVEVLLHKCSDCGFFDRGECNQVGMLPTCFEASVHTFEVERRVKVGWTEPWKPRKPVQKPPVLPPWTAGPDDKPLVHDLDTKAKVHDLLWHELFQNMKRIPPGIRVGLTVHWSEEKPVPENDELARRVRAKLKERSDEKAKGPKAD